MGPSANRLALSATIHCLTGCSIGEAIGLVIANALHWSNAASIVLAIVLAFLSGMKARRRAATNLLLMSAAVALTYAIGALARGVWGISI